MNDEIIKNFDLSIIKQLFGFLKPYRKKVIFSLIALMMVLSAELGGIVLLQKGIDHGMMKKDFSYLLGVAMGLLGLIVVGLLAGFYQIYTMNKISQTVMLDLRQSLFSHLQKQSSHYLTQHPTGKLVSVITSDVGTLSDFFNTLFLSMLRNLLLMVGSVITLFLLNPTLAFFTVLSLPPVVILTMFFRLYSRKAYRKIRSQVSKINAFLSEHIQGISIIQLFTAEQRIKEQFHYENKTLLKVNLIETTINTIFRPLVDLLWTMSLCFLIWFGMGLTQQGALSIGILIAFISLVDRFYDPVEEIAEEFTLLQSAMAGAERIFAFLKESHAIPDKGSIDFDKASSTSIVFENVKFSYTPNEKVLQGLSFSIQEGQTVALVGYTGAGKSTIINLLTRMWDRDSGRILCGEHDIRDYTLDSLRGNIQSVLQDVFLFSTTVIKNIDLGRSLSRQKIEEICHQVHAHPFISKLPQGYDTLLNEGANALSAGQRQLVSFARVLAQDPKILILDEATANIDAETEHLIQQALKVLLKGRTNLIIAHRLSTIRHADKILVLDQGKLLEEGTHEELLARKGFYFNLYKLQFEAKNFR